MKSHSEQLAIPGCEKATDAAMAQRGSNAPLRPKAPQQPASTLGGLFGDTMRQTDLIDLMRGR